MSPKVVYVTSDGDIWFGLMKGNYSLNDLFDLLGESMMVNLDISSHGLLGLEFFVMVKVWKDGYQYSLCLRDIFNLTVDVVGAGSPYLFKVVLAFTLVREQCIWLEVEPRVCVFFTPIVMRISEWVRFSVMLELLSLDSIMEMVVITLGSFPTVGVGGFLGNQRFVSSLEGSLVRWKDEHVVTLPNLEGKEKAEASSTVLSSILVLDVGVGSPTHVILMEKCFVDANVFQVPHSLLEMIVIVMYSVSFGKDKDIVGTTPQVFDAMPLRNMGHRMVGFSHGFICDFIGLADSFFGEDVNSVWIVVVLPLITEVRRNTLFGFFLLDGRAESVNKLHMLDRMAVRAVGNYVDDFSFNVTKLNVEIKVLFLVALVCYVGAILEDIGIPRLSGADGLSRGDVSRKQSDVKQMDYVGTKLVATVNRLGSHYVAMQGPKMMPVVHQWTENNGCFVNRSY